MCLNYYINLENNTDCTHTVNVVQVLTAAYDGAILAHPLQWGELVSDKVDKQGANWYALEVSQEHIDAGFVVSAYSSAASKFKLLLFEKTPEGVNELVAQASTPLCV